MESPSISSMCKSKQNVGVCKNIFPQHEQSSCPLYTVQDVSHSQFAYSCQVWSPQCVSLILEMEKVQRRATRVIMSLPYQSEISYKDRLLRTGLLPLSYWHEYLDLMCFFKAMLNNDQNIKLKLCNRVTRNDTTNGVSVNIPKLNTLTYQNSYYNRTLSAFNSLPLHIRGKDVVTIRQFREYLLNYYHEMIELVDDIDVPQTFKTVCVKCHTCRPLSSLVDKMCCS